MSNPSNAVVTSRNDIRTLLAKPETIRELGRVATKHMTADRLARLVLSACNRVPALLNCTPQSVLQCALTCSQYGVEPDGRHSHLIPYGNQCTLIIDWKGYVALGRRAGVESIVADTICERDEFTYYRDEQGTHFKHVPKFGDRGDIIGAYSTAKIDGQFDVEVLTRDEIDGIRKRSRAGGSGPWATDFGEMAKKTAIRRHSKRWPLSEEVAGAFTADDDVPDRLKQSDGPTFGAPDSAQDSSAEAQGGTRVVTGPSGTAPAAQPQSGQPANPPAEPAKQPGPPKPKKTRTPKPQEHPAPQNPEPEPHSDPEPTPEPLPTANPEPEQLPTESPEPTAKQKVAAFLDAHGISFDDFRDWLQNAGVMQDSSSIGQVEQLPEAAAAIITEGDNRMLKRCATIYGKK